MSTLQKLIKMLNQEIVCLGIIITLCLSEGNARNIFLSCYFWDPKTKWQFFLHCCWHFCKKKFDFLNENNESKKNLQQKNLNLIVRISFQGKSSGYTLDIILSKDCKKTLLWWQGTRTKLIYIYTSVWGQIRPKERQ